MSLCFYVIRSFLPSLLVGCRDADHKIKSPPDWHHTNKTHVCGYLLCLLLAPQKNAYVRILCCLFGTTQHNARVRFLVFVIGTTQNMYGHFLYGHFFNSHHFPQV
jgi:hypothetical protein